MLQPTMVQSVSHAVEEQRQERHMKLLHLAGVAFEIPDYYSDVTPIGIGGYGVVASATDTRTGTKFAIKRAGNAFKDVEYAKRTYREIALLCSMRHPNILSLCDAFFGLPQILYVVTELMDGDLRYLISQQQLQLDYIRYFTYQILCGLNYMHAAHVIHRDLSPSNILVNQSGQIRICDLGLARESAEDSTLTSYVIARYYRAPEVVLSLKYNTAVDMWSLGCIVAEMFLGKVFLPGQDAAQQYRIISEVLGTPSQDVLLRLCPPDVLTFVNSQPVTPAPDFRMLFSTAEEEDCELLRALLTFDPAARVTARDALAYSALEMFRDESTEFVPELPFTPTTRETVPEWIELVSRVVEDFKRHSS